jgi:hypothetical protein
MSRSHTEWSLCHACRSSDYGSACKANLEAIAANRVSAEVTNAGPARQLHRKLLSMQGKLPEGGSRFWDY